MHAYSMTSLPIRLRRLSPKELTLHETLVCPVYVQESGIYTKVMQKNQLLDREELKKVLISTGGKIYTDLQGQNELVDFLQEELRSVARKLSIGNIQENARRTINLLTLNSRYLYDDPTDDLKLNLQYQSVRGLCYFLINNIDMHPQIYRDFMAQKFHYIIAQPFLSSLLLVGILKQTKAFNDKEMENLFIASYFKDIGMGLLPKKIYDNPHLNANEREILKKHPKYSTQILAGRIPINSNGLKIIEGHHNISVLNPNQKAQNVISGVETMLVNVTDIIAAMISERPYRSATTLFASLELVKGLMLNNFPLEFKAIVSHFKNFFNS
jgi:HD-GYP domain-containing protein (c-di-GMP phosphodiesterase class II)